MILHVERSYGSFALNTAFERAASYSSLSDFFNAYVCRQLK